MNKVLALAVSLLLCICASGQDILQPAVDGVLVDAVKDHEQGDRQTAIKKLTALLETAPDNDAAHYYLGAWLFAEGQADEAESHLLRAVQLDTTNQWYQDALALLYMQIGREDRAAPLYEKLVRKYPSQYHNSYILTILGDSHAARNRLDEAAGWYDQALEMEPGYPPALLGKADVLRRQRDMPGYFRLLDSVAADQELVPEAKCSYFNALFGSYPPQFFENFGPEISGLMQSLLRAHPDNSAAHTLNLQVQITLSDWPAVIRECQDIIALDPRDTTALLQSYSLIGDSYYTMGDARNAFKAYDKALKIQPDYLPVLNNYAYYLSQEVKNLRKALKMSKKTIEAEPDNATYLDTYGWILHLLGRSKEAKPVFKHAMIYGGRESAVVLAHYAQVLHALGEEDVATYYEGLARNLSGKQ